MRKVKRPDLRPRIIEDPLLTVGTVLEHKLNPGSKVEVIVVASVWLDTLVTVKDQTSGIKSTVRKGWLLKHFRVMNGD